MHEKSFLNKYTRSKEDFWQRQEKPIKNTKPPVPPPKPKPLKTKCRPKAASCNQ